MKDVANINERNREDKFNDSKNSRGSSNDISEHEKRLIERENFENKSNKSGNKLFHSVQIRTNNNMHLDRMNNFTNRITIDGDPKNVNINSPEVLVNTLKDAISETNKQYKILRREFIDEIKKKTESQQLLQKCIEDLKLEISLSSKDLQSFSTKFILNYI